MPKNSTDTIIQQPRNASVERARPLVVAHHEGHRLIHTGLAVRHARRGPGRGACRLCPVWSRRWPIGYSEKADIRRWRITTTKTEVTSKTQQAQGANIKHPGESLSMRAGAQAAGPLGLPTGPLSLRYPSPHVSRALRVRMGGHRELSITRRYSVFWRVLGTF